MASVQASAPAGEAYHAQSVDEVVAALGTSVDDGLTASEAAARRQQYGPNALQQEAKASVWQVALAQLVDPMNVMLVVVAVVSLVIGEVSTAILVGVLVVVNVAMGARQELKARASVAALEELQVPRARVLRDGSVQEVDATALVPGDVAMVEAGDLVPADGRLVRAATLEVQEAALTGESAPVPKDPAPAAGVDVALGDRHDMVFQNTSVTRGTATFVVTATGMSTEMGRIAGLLQTVKRTRSPLQRELDDLTKKLGAVAWGALVIIVIGGLIRGLAFSDLLLLGIAMAISAIPTGMPTFVQTMLSYGAKKLAAAKAIVRNLTDVETLGATSAINTDKTGTLTLNQMTARALYYGGTWYHVEGGGYAKRGAILGVSGEEPPDTTMLADGLVLCSDAIVSDDGDVVGDPTEAALVVLAAKAGVDAENTRRALPRLAEVPFDSAYKFMATFHRATRRGEEQLFELVKGAPDVVLQRCTKALWHDGEVVDIDEARAEIQQANRELSEKGLRVLSFAARRLELTDEPAIRNDPMAFVQELVFVALVGIIDPLRPEARDAVRTALGAGIDVRMITGDYPVTAKAIGEDLGLGPGVISGPDFDKLPDGQLVESLPELHVFGRVSPENKLRLVSVMQEQGLVVAMTGDAVNDAAALKKADIGVAMGSGSEVSKQAAKMVLTDDNFATLVHAVSLGRDIYAKITSYIRYQMSQLFGLVSMFILATLLDINQGFALTPLMALFLNFFVSIFPVIAISTDVDDPTVMAQPPRDPTTRIFNRVTAPRWIAYGLVLGLASLVPLVWGPDEPALDAPTTSMTMAFVVMALGTAFSGLVMRRDPAPAWTPPVVRFASILSAAVALTILATELRFLQRGLSTVPLTGSQWLACIGLALILPVVVEVDKAIRRLRHPGTLAAPAAP